jgi:hypothetical protein
MNNAISRRAALAGIASVAAAVPAVAIPATSAVAGFTPDRSAWDAAMAAFQRAEAEADAFEVVFMPIHDRCKAEIELQLPHKLLPRHLHIGKLCPSTADWQYISRCRHYVEEWDASKIVVDDTVRERYNEHIAICRGAIRADEERKAGIAAIERKHGYAEAEQKMETLGDARYETEWALMDLPAPDLPALRWKLEKLLEIENSSTAPWSSEAVGQTVADIQRLMAGRA